LVSTNLKKAIRGGGASKGVVAGSESMKIQKVQ